MAMNAFIIFQGAKGESLQSEFKDWIEIQGWSWDIEAETSWTKGGGASVGKANPGVMGLDHYYDSASPVIMAYLCMGKHFEKVTMKLCKTTGKGSPEWYLDFTMKGVYITKVGNSGGEDGAVTQHVDFVFKEIEILYRKQDNTTGALQSPSKFKWDIPKMVASN
jgi:type VI secretion system secreted protein Hcp